MQTSGGRPSSLFGRARSALRGWGGGLLRFLALNVFYPLAAWPVGRAVRQKNLAQNAATGPAGGLIQNQQAPEVRTLRCGHALVGECGCGPVSVYNALCLLGRGGRGEPGGQGLSGVSAPIPSAPGLPVPDSPAPGSPSISEPQPSLAEVISQFERRRALALGGRAGASPYAVPRVLRQYGLAAAPAGSPAALEALPPGGVGIVMIWNDRERTLSGAHFFAVQRAQSGKGFVGYNCQPGRADTLAGLIGNGRFAAGWRVERPAGEPPGHN